METVEDYFAAGCSNLTSIALPDTTTEIGRFVLNQCRELQGIDLTNTAVQTVGASFASGWSNLGTVRLPDTMRVIGSKFREECGQLQVIDAGSVNAWGTAIQEIHEIVLSLFLIHRT